MYNCRKLAQKMEILAAQETLKFVSGLVAAASTLIAVRGDTRDRSTGKTTRFGWGIMTLAILSLVVTLAVQINEYSDKVSGDKKALSRHTEIVGGLEVQLKRQIEQTKKLAEVAEQSRAQLEGQVKESARLAAVSEDLKGATLASYSFSSLQIVAEFDKETVLRPDFKGKQQFMLTLHATRGKDQDMLIELYAPVERDPFGVDVFGILSFGSFRPPMSIPLLDETGVRRTSRDNVVSYHDHEEFVDSRYSGPIFAGRVVKTRLDEPIERLKKSIEANWRVYHFEPRWPFETLRDFSGTELFVSISGAYAPMVKWLHLGFNDTFWLKIPASEHRVRDTFGALRRDFEHTSTR